MGIFDHNDVITEYSIREAVEMGALVEVFKDRWKELSGGKPIVASANVVEFEGEGGLKEIWNRFVFWQKHIFPKLENPPFSQRIYGGTWSGFLMIGCVLQYCIRRIIEKGAS